MDGIQYVEEDLYLKEPTFKFTIDSIHRMKL